MEESLNEREWNNCKEPLLNRIKKRAFDEFVFSFASVLEVKCDYKFGRCCLCHLEKD